MMRVFTQIPHPLLRPHIDRFWGWECGTDEQVALPVVLPGTGAELFFHYGTPFQRALQGAAHSSLERSHLLCVRQQPLPLAPLHGIGFIAVRFRAGRLGSLTPLPVGECFDRQLPAEALWGRQARELDEKIFSTRDFAQRVALLEAFLLQQLETCAADPVAEQTVEHIYRSPHAAAMDELAHAARLGYRQLERRFLRQEGLTPVEFRRLVRFQKSVRRLMLEPNLPLLDVALAHGYFDQSHFCRDFKAFCGQSPQRHLAMARDMTHFYNTSRR